MHRKQGNNIMLSFSLESIPGGLGKKFIKLLRSILDFQTCPEKSSNQKISTDVFPRTFINIFSRKCELKINSKRIRFLC